MSGVKVSLDASQDEGHAGRRIHVVMIDEVYYPVVSVINTKTAEIAESIEAKTLEPQTAESPERMSTESVVLTSVAKNLDENEPEQKRRGLKIWCSRIATTAVALMAVIAIGLIGMRLAGFRTFTVMSGSMEPGYPVGSMIYVRPVDYHNLKVGDVISYVANDDKTIVTHRITNIEVDENDSSVWRFETKGDANTAVDAKLVHYKNVLGTPIITIPLIGYFAHNIQQPPGIYITLVVGTLLLAWTFLPGTLEERRKTARKSIV